MRYHRLAGKTTRGDDHAVSPVVGTLLLVATVLLMAVGAFLVLEDRSESTQPVRADMRVLPVDADAQPGWDGAVLEVNQLVGADRLEDVRLFYRNRSWTIAGGLEKGDTLRLPCPGEDPSLTVSVSHPTTGDRETVGWWHVPRCGQTTGPSNSPPAAAFTYTCTDLSCEFDAELSVDRDGSIPGYDWALGDGSTATGQTVSHTYDQDGDYTVTLTVTDDDGATDDDAQTVHVEDGASSGSGDDTWTCIDAGPRVDSLCFK